MKLNELISEFSIYLSNEEKALRKKLDKPRTLATFSERDQFIIENLVRKSMVSKIKYKNTTLVVNNEL